MVCRFVCCFDVVLMCCYGLSSMVGVVKVQKISVGAVVGVVTVRVFWVEVKTVRVDTVIVIADGGGFGGCFFFFSRTVIYLLLLLSEMGDFVG